MARDALGKFGAIALATKDTQVYCADPLDLDALDARYSKSTKHYIGVGGRDLAVVFKTPADFVSVDSFIPIIQDSADNSTWNDLATGPQTAAGYPKKGIAAVMPIPRQVRRYIRASAMPKNTGTFTASTLEAWLEHGPNDE
jgi:hypothetical protein